MRAVDHMARYSTVREDIRALARFDRSALHGRRRATLTDLNGLLVLYVRAIGSCASWKRRRRRSFHSCYSVDAPSVTRIGVWRR